MRILFVVEAALGGTGEVVLVLVEQLRRAGHEPGLLYSGRRVDARFQSTTKELLREGVPIEETALHPYRGPRAARASWAAIRREAPRYDAVHLHGAWGGLFGRAALWRTRRPVVYSPHGGAFHPRQKGIYALGRRFERILARKTAAFVVSSEYEETLVRDVIRSPRCLRLIAHGRPDAPDVATPPTLSSGPRFGVVGRVVEEKRLDLAVDALAIVRDRLPGAELVVVGDGPYERDLTDRAASAGVAAAVTMLGFVEEKSEIYRAIDVLLLPSDSEATPLVVAEAQGYGIPAIVTASGGGPLAVDDGVDGLVVPRGDKQRMADAMVRIAASPDAYGSFARAALDAARRYPTWEEVAARYVDLYRELGA